MKKRYALVGCTADNKTAGGFLISLLVCCFIVACEPSESHDGPSEALQKSSGFDYESANVVVNNAKLHYLYVDNYLHVDKKPDNNVMVFLHGFPHIAEVWYPLLNHFAHDYRVFAPDLKGYGRSEKPALSSAYDIEQLVNDIVGLIQHVSPDKPVTLIAHDWGGVIAWGIAQTQPHLIERLIVINAPQYNAFLHTLDTSEAQRKASQYIQKLDSWWAELLFWWKGPELLWRGLKEAYAQGNIAQEYKQVFFSQWHNKASARAAIAYYTENFPDFNSINDSHFWPDPYATADVESLLIWSTKDRAFTSDALLKTQQFATQLSTHFIDTTSHTPFLTHSQEVIETIDLFLKEKAENDVP